MEDEDPLLRKGNAHDRRCMDDWSLKSDDGTECTSHTEDDDGDAIWIPPEAAAAADDHHVGSRSSIDDNDSDHHSRESAVLKAMNGQLKILAARFLASAGISLPHQKEPHDSSSSSSWLDIVTSLSWEAALLIKPDGAVGEGMDPASYIKVKCVASGNPRQCEVIKGLVFKKNAAHKHMPTRCHNPRLLLLRGVLGDSDAAFSSFSSMEKEKDHLQKSVSKMMEMCRPNVIMVEKTVSRDIQELLLKEGVTLVLDMKLNRLQRIARFSGSSIVSFSEALSKPKLKHCDYFHIEKVMEEPPLQHTGHVGKRTSKTLMFLEGFHKPSGCTILLRGANSEELKKIKQVMHCTVFAAYHLILETSFFEDQRVFLNNSKQATGAMSGPPVIHRETLRDDYSLSLSPEDTKAAAFKLYPGTHNGQDIPSDSNQAVPSERLPSPVSGSRKRFMDMFCHQNIYLPFTSAYEVTKDEESLHNSQQVAGTQLHISPKAAGSGGNVNRHASDPQKQEQTSSELDQETASNDSCAGQKHDIPLENEQHRNTGYYISGERTSDTDEQGDDVLESQSILVLMSSQCITKQVICEHSHLYRIKYYGNFDVSLGRYLQDILQSQAILRIG